MNFSRPFILRPIATSLLMVALLVAGMLAWRLLPVAALPQVDYPVIQVQATLPGASPDTVARMITAPLERYLGQISGLKQMSSASGAGVSVITLQFALDSDLGVAEQDVQSALDNAESLLPDGMPAPPRYRKVNPADTPILTLAVSSKTLPLPQIHDLVDTRMAQKLAQVQGVGQVSLAGGQRPAIRVQADSAALKAARLTLADVQKVIASANANLPKGSFDGPVRSTMLDANDQLTTVAQYEDLVVTWKNGVPLRVRDVATVVQGPEDRFLAAWADAERAILISVQRQPDANVIEVADRVRVLLPRLTATLPASVDVRILTDRTESIRSSVRDVQVELGLAVGLVVLVTLVFLRSVRMTLIPAVVVPISLVGTFAAMYLADYSLNNLSLMALTIATGFVVDDAIVMMENIARHREQGKPALQAALDGAKEIGFTLVSLTASLVAVLIPLLFMGDVVGRLFHEFAVTLAVAIGISLLVSLTLTPMMSARMLKGETGHGGAGPSACPALLDRLIAAYGRSLDRVLDHQGLMLLVMLATLGLYTPFARYRSIKYFYGHTQVAGSPLEFSVRRPWRMFLGFVVMLSFYGLFEAQEIFDRIPKTGKPGQDLLCEPLKIDWTFYCKKCDGMASMRTCPHTKEDRVILSGTKLRKMLSEGLEVPDHFGRDEVLVILREYYSSLTEKVEVKMQRAASGSAM